MVMNRGAYCQGKYGILSKRGCPRPCRYVMQGWICSSWRKRNDRYLLQCLHDMHCSRMLAVSRARKPQRSGRWRAAAADACSAPADYRPYRRARAIIATSRNLLCLNELQFVHAKTRLRGAFDPKLSVGALRKLPPESRKVVAPRSSLFSLLEDKGIRWSRQSPLATLQSGANCNMQTLPNRLTSSLWRAARILANAARFIRTGPKSNKSA